MMAFLPLLFLLCSLAALGSSEVTYGTWQDTSTAQAPADTPRISDTTREYWMQQAIQALHDLVSPCPFAAYGTVIVNHTSTSEKGDLVCIGANAVGSTGNPTLHGEIAGIKNCTAILTDRDGQYKLSPSEALAAFEDLTLYTTAEPCPMCATAIRWGGFRECVFGTSIATLIKQGWSQLDLPSTEVFQRSHALGHHTDLLEDVLAPETDPYLAWQYDPSKSCPRGCQRENHSEVFQDRTKEKAAKEQTHVGRHIVYSGHLASVQTQTEAALHLTPMDQEQAQQGDDDHPGQKDRGHRHQKGRGGRRKHHHDGPHPQTHDLPTPSDAGVHTSADDNAAGSPKVAFSAGLPTRIASGEFLKPFNFHAQTDDLTDEEQVILRQMDIERILNSIRLLGYEVNQAPGTSGVLQGHGVTFFHINADPLQRLSSLVTSMHQELDRLVPMLHEQPRRPMVIDGTANRWKEDATMGLLTQIMPAVGRLGDRLAREAAVVVEAHQGRLRFYVG